MEASNDVVSKFVSNRSGLAKMFSDLEGRDEPYTQTVQIFSGEPELLLAVLLQNSLHPKNSKRTDAIKDGKYVEIETVE